jgi:hypothetical protein
VDQQHPRVVRLDLDVDGAANDAEQLLRQKSKTTYLSSASSRSFSARSTLRNDPPQAARVARTHDGPAL